MKKLAIITALLFSMAVQAYLIWPTTVPPYAYKQVIDYEGWTVDDFTSYPHYYEILMWFEQETWWLQHHSIVLPVDSLPRCGSMADSWEQARSSGHVSVNHHRNFAS